MFFCLFVCLMVSCVHNIGLDLLNFGLRIFKIS